MENKINEHLCRFFMQLRKHVVPVVGGYYNIRMNEDTLGMLDVRR